MVEEKKTVEETKKEELPKIDQPVADSKDAKPVEKLLETKEENKAEIGNKPQQEEKSAE